MSVSAVWLDARSGDSRWVCGDNALSTGLRRNTAAMRELRCCCRGMRYGCFRWWRRSAARPACKRAASYGGARTGVASFCLGFAFGRPPRARATLETETCCLLKICLCCFKLHHPSRPPYPRHTPTSSSFPFAPRPKGLSIHSPLTQAPRCNQRALPLSPPSHICKHVELTMSAPHGRRLSPCLSPYPELKKREESDARACRRSLPLIRR